MKSKQISILLLLLILTSCSGPRVYNVSNAAVPASDAQLTVEEIGEAIEHTAEFLGWKIRPLGPRSVIATLVRRAHTVQVMINYSPEKYDIKYYDSRNLEYDGNKIHEAYNIWVKEFDARLQKELSLFLARR